MLKKYSRVSCTLQGRSIVFAQKRGGGRQTKKDYQIKKEVGSLLCCYVSAKAVRMAWRTFQNIGLQIRKQGFL